jgi:hypothetical protein
MIVLQKRVATFVVRPAHPDECRSARVRLALRKSALVNIEEKSLAPHRLAPVKIVFFIDELCRSTPSRFRPAKLQPLRLALGPGLAQLAASAARSGRPSRSGGGAAA